MIVYKAFTRLDSGELVSLSHETVPELAHVYQEGEANRGQHGPLFACNTLQQAIGMTFECENWEVWCCKAKEAVVPVYRRLSLTPEISPAEADAWWKSGQKEPGRMAFDLADGVILCDTITLSKCICAKEISAN